MKGIMNVEDRILFLNTLLRELLNDEGKKQFYDDILWGFYFLKGRITHQYLDFREAEIARIAKNYKNRING